MRLAWFLAYIGDAFTPLDLSGRLLRKVRLKNLRSEHRRLTPFERKVFFRRVDRKRKWGKYVIYQTSAHKSFAGLHRTNWVLKLFYTCYVHFWRHLRSLKETATVFQNSCEVGPYHLKTYSLCRLDLKDLRHRFSATFVKPEPLNQFAWTDQSAT